MPKSMMLREAQVHMQLNPQLWHLGRCMKTTRLSSQNVLPFCTTERSKLQNLE